MKNLVIAILLIATLTFGGLFVRQTQKTSQAQANAELAQQTIGELQATLAEQQKKSGGLEQRLEDSRAHAAIKSEEAAAISKMLEAETTNRSHRTTADTSGKTNSNPLAAMFKNPEMREMIKKQQKAMMGTILEKNYAKLFASLNLTSEQATTFKDMLLNKQMGSAELGLSMVSGDVDAAQRAEMVEKVKTANETADAQIKDFLGADNFAQFQDYEKSMSERMAVSGFKDQISTGMALSDDQEQQLIQAMTQARQDFKFTSDLSDKSKFGGDYSSMFKEEKMQVYFDELEKLNQQYLNRAEGILSADQAAAFGKYLTNQQAMQKAGMQMASKMFAPQKSAEDK